MPKQSIVTEVDGRKLKLSNPTKILYPEDGITKAEIIQYYLQVAEVMLKHIAKRPLTLIRYPDGIHATQFYAKNKPTWTPDWISSTYIGGDHDKYYVLADERATLVWIANLAGLEIHPMNVRSPNLDYPDQFIFDLDPSEEFGFEALKELALSLKDHLSGYGYSSYVKTSGGKGLHIYVPIRPLYHKDEVYQAVEAVAKDYVRAHPEITTLSISKDRRKGKVLLDIYRNRSSQSAVAPYSLRGKVGAPVSMPIRWEELKALNNSKAYNISTALSYLKEHGDAWSAIWDNAEKLHTKTHKKSRVSAYDQKRDFNKTNEPQDDINTDDLPRDGYVVQIHDASNLHYDLRLAENGVLLSWALPKGMPHDIGVKRLAIRTEDHPLKYLAFEGVIPKGEYGGGEMWIFDSGRYEMINRTDKKIHFVLKEGKLAGEYVLYRTKDKQWIIELKSQRGFNIDVYKSPMLAVMGEKLVKSKKYSYEIKWDGIRAIFHIENGKLSIFSRNGNDITDQFPKLQIMVDHIEAEIAVMDGEIVHLDSKGRPDFSKIVGRIHVKGDRNIALAADRNPATVYLFDLLYLDGKDCRKEPCSRRRNWLKTILDIGDKVRYSESFEDGKQLFEAIKIQGMEGVMMKDMTAAYTSDARTSAWKKIKVRHDDEAWVIGYTKGQGDRSDTIGAIHLAKDVAGELIYMGKVGTGFTMELLKNIQRKLEKVDKTKKPIKDKIEEESRSTWIEPTYKVNLNYASLSSNGTYREPVFQDMVKAK